MSDLISTSVDDLFVSTACTVVMIDELTGRFEEVALDKFCPRGVLDVVNSRCGVRLVQIPSDIDVVKMVASVVVQTHQVYDENRDHRVKWTFIGPRDQWHD